MGIKRRKTRIMAIGDIHGDTSLVKRLAKKAEDENVDLVVLTGDMTFAEISTKNLVGPFVKAKKPVLLLHGNHESIATIDFLAEMYPNTKNLHGYSFVKDGVGIFGAGGADMGISSTSDAEIFKLLKEGHEKVKDSERKVMITHMHPKGTMSEFSGWPGSKSIRKAIDKFKPDIAICSHIHEASGVEEKIGNTLVVNVARKERIFEI